MFNLVINKKIEYFHSSYVDSDFLLFKFKYHRRCFREDIFEKCILFKKENNGIKHLINEYIELKGLRDKLINQLNKLDKKIDKLKKIEYY
jgi:hypothetical protein